MTVRDRASDMTIELDSVAANAPDNAEGATVRTARYAINAAHASGNITGEQHAEALRKLLMNGHALNASPAIQAERQREADVWLRRVLVGFGFSFLLTVAVIVMVSLSCRFISHLHTSPARERMLPKRCNVIPGARQVGSPAHRGQRCRPPIGGTKGMTINSWTYGLIYLSAILWRVVKAANRIVLFFLGLIVLI